MKKEVLLLILIIFVSSAYATCDVTDTIYKGSSKAYTINGKDYNITFSSLKNDSDGTFVKFKVNGVSTPDMEQSAKYSFNDLSEITITSISIGPGALNGSAQICFTAGLVGFGKGTCTSNSDCEDNSSCTIDYCDGDPLRCHHKLILWCKNNDGCCPEGRCTIEKDNDCKKINLSLNDSAHYGNNSNITYQESQQENKTKITKCLAGDSYCPENCTFKLDPDCDECSTDVDCEDNNACTSDACSGIPNRCLNNATSGCNFNGTCISIGTKVENYFCNKDNALESLKSKKEYCDNNYECLSNICIKNKCKNPSFIKTITGWFKGLFGQ